MTWYLVAKSAQLELWHHNYAVGMIHCRTVVVKMPHQYLVYSAGVGLSESFKTQFKPESSDKVDLFLPNSWHHMGVKEWSQTFPQARRFAHKNALRRLKRKGLDNVQDADALKLTGVRMTCLEGNRMGEAWLEVDTDNGTAWVVADAFFNFKELPKPFLARVALVLMRSAPGLRISRLYLTSVKDRKGYKAWLLNKIQSVKPAILVPNHGNIITTGTASLLESAVLASL